MKKKLSKQELALKKIAAAQQAYVNDHIANIENPHGVTKTQIGLENVTNHAQVKRSEMGVANGVATLDSSGKVPSSQLPSYVDNSDTERVIASALNDLNQRINNLDIPEISTNIVTDKASNVKAASPKAVYNEIHPAVQSSQPQGGMLPNVMYTLGTLTGSVTFTLAAGTSGIVNHYYWTFDTGSTAPTITWPSGLTWNGGSAPTITASKHYEISVLNNVAIYIQV